MRFQALNDPGADHVRQRAAHRRCRSTASGGSQALTYSVTGSYSDETGLLTLPAFEVERFRTRFNREPPDWMRRPHQFEQVERHEQRDGAARPHGRRDAHDQRCRARSSSAPSLESNGRAARRDLRRSG